MARDQDPARACVQARTAQGSLNRRPDISHRVSLAREHLLSADGRVAGLALQTPQLLPAMPTKLATISAESWK